MGRSTPGERRNVAILTVNQALYGVAAITAATLGGIVGAQLAPNPALATLPVAAGMVGVVATALPASLLMKRLGRRTGFVIGALTGGVGGGALSVYAINAGSFALFCLGGLLIGVYQAFAAYYRFAASDASRPTFQSTAISLVLAGGVASAFAGPFNASRAVGMFPGVAEAGPYAMLIALSLLGAGLHLGLRIPDERRAAEGAQRPLREIAAQPALRTAVVVATVGYTVMVMTMTAMPLGMQHDGFELHHSATVMQWHVLGMFAPSFFSGRLIALFGLPLILLTGAGAQAASIAIAATGQGMANYWIALVLLGIGWNFLFVGGSTLLATTHTPAERGKVQGLNEFVVFAAVAIGSLLAGALLHSVGWARLNLLLLPLVVLSAGAVLWWQVRTGGLPAAAPPAVEPPAATAD